MFNNDEDAELFLNNLRKIDRSKIEVISLDEYGLYDPFKLRFYQNRAEEVRKLFKKLGIKRITVTVQISPHTHKCIYIKVPTLEVLTKDNMRIIYKIKYEIESIVLLAYPNSRDMDCGVLQILKSEFEFI